MNWNKLFIAACLLVAHCNSSFAWTHGKPTANGTSSLNIGEGNFYGPSGVNWLAGGRWSVAAGNLTDIALLDEDQYLTGTPTGSFEIVMDSVGNYMWANTQFKLIWEAGIKFKYVLKQNITSCVAINVTINAGCSGSTATITASNGLAGSLTFTYTSTSSPVMSSATDGVYVRPAGAKMALYRISDEARYQAGIYLTPENEAAMAGLHSGTLRPMGAIQAGNSNFNGETVWRNRNKPTNLVWRMGIPKGAVPSSGGSCGAALICNTGNAYSADPSPDVAGTTWVDGDQIVGKVQTTNSGAATFTVAGRTPKRLLTNVGFLITAASALTANSLGTFTYNATLDSVLYNVGTVQGSVPIEARVQLANRLKLNLWDTIPPWALDDYVTQQATYARDNLNTSLFWTPEWSNEIWNVGFPQSNWSYNMGAALGWSVSNNQAKFSYYGLRFRQIFGNVIPPIFVGQTSRVRPVSAFQTGVLAASTTTDFQLNGTVLKNNGYSISSTATFSVGSPCVIIWSNALGPNVLGIQISLISTGVLPTGINSGQLYYVVNNITPNLNLSLTAGGTPIDCSGSPTGTATASYTNTLYNSIVGQDYTVKPNRPVDFAYYTSTAPYIGAANICPNDPTACRLTVGINAGFWQNLITTWESGQEATAVNLIEADARAGIISGTIQTVTAVTTTFTTPLPHGFFVNSLAMFRVTGGTTYSGITVDRVYRVSATPTTTTFSIQAYNSDGIPSGATINAGSAGSGVTTVGNPGPSTLQLLDQTKLLNADRVASSYDSDRPVGAINLVNAMYEGSIEIGPLSAANCTTLGITATNCAQSSSDAIEAWRTSALSRQFQFDYYTCSVGAYAGCVFTFGNITHSKNPSNLILTCPNIWTLIPTCYPNGTPYPLYYGVSDFNALP